MAGRSGPLRAWVVTPRSSAAVGSFMTGDATCSAPEVPPRAIPTRIRSRRRRGPKWCGALGHLGQRRRVRYGCVMTELADSVGTVAHPLASITAEEIRTAVAAVRADGRLDERA